MGAKWTPPPGVCIGWRAGVRAEASQAAATSACAFGEVLMIPGLPADEAVGVPGQTWEGRGREGVAPAGRTSAPLAVGEALAVAAGAVTGPTGKPMSPRSTTPRRRPLSSAALLTEAAAAAAAAAAAYLAACGCVYVYIYIYVCIERERCNYIYAYIYIYVYVCTYVYIYI